MLAYDLGRQLIEAARENPELEVEVFYITAAHHARDDSVPMLVRKTIRNGPDILLIAPDDPEVHDMMQYNRHVLQTLMRDHDHRIYLDNVIYREGEDDAAGLLPGERE